MLEQQQPNNQIIDDQNNNDDSVEVSNRRYEGKILGLVLVGMMERRMADVMRRLETGSYRRLSTQFAVRIITSMYARCQKRTAFVNIKQRNTHPIATHPHNQTKQLLSQYLTTTSLPQSQPQHLAQSYPQSKTIYQIIRADLQQLTSSTDNDNDNDNRLYKKGLHLVQLQFRNRMLVAQVTKLREEIQELNRRQQRENMKKRESLEMLAEELQDKNQVIQDLRRSLHLYQLRYETANDILDSDYQQLKQQLQTSQKIRQKLQSDLNNTKSKLETTCQTLKQCQSQIQTLSQQLKQYQNNQLLNQHRSHLLNKSQQQLDKLIKNVKEKMKQIHFYYKGVIENNCEDNRNGEAEGRGNLERVCQLENEVKLQIVFDYLANFPEIGNDINYCLFTTQQINILQKHRLDWLDRKNMKDLHIGQHDSHEEVSGIISKGLHQNHHHSIFQFLDFPDLPHSQLPQPNPSHLNPHINPHLNPCQQKHQVQLQSQIQKLKTKILQIRNMVLRLLKTLDIDMGKNTEVLAAVEVVLDIFQYSEEERLGIFQRKRRFFGFL